MQNHWLLVSTLAWLLQSGTVWATHQSLDASGLRQEGEIFDGEVDETVWIQRADELDEVINLQSPRLQSRGPEENHTLLATKQIETRDATLLLNRSAAADSQSTGELELVHAGNHSVWAEDANLEASSIDRNRTALQNGPAHTPSKLNGDFTDVTQASDALVAGVWHLLQLFSTKSVDIGPDISNTSELNVVNESRRLVHVARIDGNGTFNFPSLLTAGIAAAQTQLFLSSLWTIVLPLSFMFLICTLAIFLLMPDASELRRSRYGSQRCQSDLDSASDRGRGAQEMRRESSSSSVGYQRKPWQRQVPAPVQSQVRASARQAVSDVGSLDLYSRPIVGPTSSFIIRGSHSITADCQLMVQSIFGPHSQANDEPIATLLYMERSGDDAPEVHSSRRVPCTGSRVLLKHGSATVAVLDTSTCRRGEKVARAHLVEDDGTIQDHVFAYIAKSGQDNRYTVCYREGEQPVYIVDCPPDSRSQRATFCDCDGSVIARMERTPQSSMNEVPYVSTINAIAADCSLVLISWVAVIKLS